MKSLRNFTKVLIMITRFNQIPGSIDWDSNAKHKPGNGQLKLLLAEMLFIHDYFDHLDINKDTHIIYAGSGKGYHIPMLIGMCNNMATWHLYDPQGHCNALLPSKNLKITNDNFIAKDFISMMNRDRDSYNLVLISDIRTSTDNTSVINDHKLHDSWIDTLQPDLCNLKWRIPYGTEFEYYQSNDMNNNHILQIYNSSISGECRMVIIGNKYSKILMTLDDQKEYENRLAYYNKYIKDFGFQLMVGKHICKIFSKKFNVDVNFNTLKNLIRKNINLDKY